MAHQELHLSSRMFTLDLHDVTVREAARIIRARLAECHRYGLRTLRVVYGSPTYLQGTILESLCEILQTDPFVITGELPEWAFDPQEGEKYPIFLVVPIKPNLKPDNLCETSTFQKFKAEYEKSLAQKLLCSMPFQPLRTVYDWKYAAKAIGDPCKPEELVKMCAQFGIGSTNNSGLNMRELMQAAESFSRWKDSCPKVIKISTEAILPSVKPEAPEVHPKPEEIPDHLEESALSAAVQPDISAILRLTDRFLENGEYGPALECLEGASELSLDKVMEFEILLRKGRTLLRMHDERCETWLLRADEACVTLYGEDSERRRDSIRMLCEWYVASGEASRVIHYASLAGKFFGSDPRWSRKRRYLNDYATANFLQASGRYLESQHVLDASMESVVLQKDGTGASGIIPEAELDNSGIPAHIIANHFLLAAKNLTHLRQFQSALLALEQAELFAKKRPQEPQLEAHVKLERGIVYRRGGFSTDRVQDLYAKALSLNNQGGSPDLTLRYLINLSSGVAYANSGDLRLAKKAYARASADADELYGSDHPELFKLLFSQSSLCAKKRDFDECVEFAQRAADILMLKAPERTGDIGLALLWAGRACNALRKYEVAAKILAEAKRHFDRTVPPPRQDHLEDLHLQIHIARTSGYVGSPF